MVIVNTNVRTRHNKSFRVVLPGTNRRRIPTEYEYLLTYRATDSSDAGCLATWIVSGGRELYQVALEQVGGGFCCWHCTCPDSVYRSERTGKMCKHILGISELMPLSDVKAIREP